MSCTHGALTNRRITVILIYYVTMPPIINNILLTKHEAIKLLNTFRILKVKRLTLKVQRTYNG